MTKILGGKWNMPPFLSGPLFFPPWPLAGPTSKKFQNYFFKILSKVPRVVFCLVFITGLGMEIGHRQPKPQRKPRLQFSANPAVYLSGRFYNPIIQLMITFIRRFLANFLGIIFIMTNHVPYGFLWHFLVLPLGKPDQSSEKVRYYGMTQWHYIYDM